MARLRLHAPIPLRLMVASARVGRRVSFFSTPGNTHYRRPNLPNDNLDLLSLVTFISLLCFELTASLNTPKLSSRAKLSFTLGPVG